MFVVCGVIVEDVVCCFGLMVCFVEGCLCFVMFVLVVFEVLVFGEIIFDIVKVFGVIFD